MSVGDSGTKIVMPWYQMPWYQMPWYQQYWTPSTPEDFAENECWAKRGGGDPIKHRKEQLEE